MQLGVESVVTHMHSELAKVKAGGGGGGERRQFGGQGKGGCREKGL